MTTIRKFDDALVFLEKRAKTIGYDIDADKRYIDLCSLVTELDMGWTAESAAGNRLIWHKIDELAKCFYPEEYGFFEKIFKS